MKQLYFYFVHSFFNCENIASASTNKTKLATEQKHGAHINNFNEKHE